jgi:YD repeat-containing protein
VAPEPTADPTVWDTMTYDSSGRPLRQEHLDNSATTTRYRVRSGFIVTETRDETTHTQTRLTDGWGALSLTEQPSITPGSIARTHYSYNLLGDLTAISHPADDPAENTVKNTFDTLGRKTSENDPDRGITTYRYDPNGNLVQQTDARNRVLEYGYDELNRRIHKTDPATGTTSTWNYDELGHGASIGRLTSIHDPSGTGCPQRTTRSLSYDTSGNTTKDTRCVDGTTQVFHSSYDAVNRLQTLTYPDREELTYIYDGAGHLFSVSGYVSSMQYNARSQLISADYANHTTSRWNHNLNRPGFIGGLVA